MARLTFFTSFSVSVLKASKTSKLMTVTHFQCFFMCPGAPKKDPKGQPNFIFCVSFFDLGPNRVQWGSRRCPRESKRSPGGPKRSPREAKGDPKGIQGNQKGAQGELRGTQREPQRRPTRVSMGNPKDPKRRPRELPGGPREVQEDPWRPQRSPGGAQGTSKRAPKGHQGESQEGPKRPRNRNVNEHAERQASYFPKLVFCSTFFFRLLSRRPAWLPRFRG